MNYKNKLFVCLYVSLLSFFTLIQAHTIHYFEYMPPQDSITVDAPVINEEHDYDYDNYDSAYDIVEEAEEVNEVYYRNLYYEDDYLYDDEKMIFPIQQRNFEPNFRDDYNAEVFDYTVEPIKIDSTKKKSYKPRRNNNYDFWNSVGVVISNIFQFIYKNSTIILIILAVLLVVLLVNNLVFDGTGLSRLFRKRGKAKKLKTNIEELAEEEPDDITEYNFKVMSTKAFDKGDYRLAYRYLFLDLLQQLDEKKIIYWKKNKTNLDYISEIKNDEIREEYKDLAKFFDYIWYGKHEVNEQQFTEYKGEYEQVEKMLSGQ